MSECPFETISLVGNHDISGDYGDTYSALKAFSGLPKISIISSPLKIGRFGYVPYIHNNQKFIEEANKLAAQGAATIISHTSYTGSRYDTGMIIPDAVDQNLIDHRVLHLISGHIHTEQLIDRVWYPGNPRWLTKACANKEKGIWFVEFANSGKMENSTFISTEFVCTPIISLVWKEGQPRPEIAANSKVDIELVGTSEWIAKEKPSLMGLASISSKTTNAKNKGVQRKSGKSLREFLIKHYPIEENKRVELIKFMEGLKLV